MEHDQSPTEGGGRPEDPPTGKRVGESAEDKTKVTVIQIVPSHNRLPNANQQEKTHRELPRVSGGSGASTVSGRSLPPQPKRKLPDRAKVANVSTASEQLLDYDSLETQPSRGPSSDLQQQLPKPRFRSNLPRPAPNTSGRGVPLPPVPE